jgi:hypothetical protein
MTDRAAGERFVSEPIAVDASTMDAAPALAGRPACPGRFTWRGATYEVVRVLGEWKKVAAEGGRAQGDHYVRAHYFRVSTNPPAECVLYCLRHARRKQPVWFLYTIRSADPPPGPPASPGPAAAIDPS